MATYQEQSLFPSPFSSLRDSLANSFNRPSRADHHQAASSSSSSSFTTSSTPARSSTICAGTSAHNGNKRSTSASPHSSLRGISCTRRAGTWNTTPRTRSRSPNSSSMHSSHTNSPLLLSRRPSAIDLALLEEEALSHNVREVGLGLGLMEPRPVVPVTVVAATHSRGTSISSRSSIFETPIEHVREEEEEDDDELVEEQKQPFVMGGIVEVLEGRS